MLEVFGNENNKYEKNNEKDIFCGSRRYFNAADDAK